MMRFGRIHLPHLGSVLAIVVAAGCTARHTVQVSDQGLPQYTRLLVTYDQAPRDIILADHAIDAETVPTSVARQVQSSRVISQLRIEFPHPQGRAGFGLATLTHTRQHTHPPRSSWWRGRELTTAEMLVDSGRSPSATRARPLKNAQGSSVGNSVGNDGASPGQAPAEDNRVWLLDISRERLDQLLVACANSGFFDETDQATGSARIAFQIDSGRSTKNSNSHPALDAIADEVAHRGRFTGPHTVLAESPAR